MQLKFETKSLANHRNEIKLEIPYQEFEKKLNQKITEYSKMIQLPGFRKGKVPKNIIVNRFSDSLKNESLKTVLNEAIEQVYKNQDIDIYGDIELKEENITYPSNEPMVVHLTAYKKPSCDIKKRAKLDFEAYSFEMTDEDFNNSKDVILTKNGSLVEIKEEAFELKDLLNINVSFSDQKHHQYDLKEHVFYFSAEKKGAIPEYLNYFYLELKKMTPKTSKEVVVTFPNEVTIKEFKNEEIKATIEINSIKRLKKAEINEAFLKKIGVASEAEFDEKLKENLTELGKKKIKEVKQLSILNAIRKNTDFNIPPSLYQRGISAAWENEKKKYGNNLPQEPPQKWVEQIQREIKLRVENELILEEVKRKEEINVGEEEMRKEVKQLAEKNQQDEKEFRIEIIKNGIYTKIKENLVIDKIFDFLYEKNNLIQKGKFPFDKI